MPRELGGRTGSVLGSIDDQGRVLLFDDMEGVLKWGEVDGQTAASVSKTTEAAYEGSYGVRVCGEVLVPNGWSWGDAGRNVGLRGNKRLRASVVFSSRGGLIAKGCKLQLRYYDGKRRWLAWCEYHFGGTDRGWHCMSMEVDLEKGLFVGAWVDGKAGGVAVTDMISSSNSGPEVLYILVSMASDIRRGKCGDFDLVLVEEV